MRKLLQFIVVLIVSASSYADSKFIKVTDVARIHNKSFEEENRSLYDTEFRVRPAIKREEQVVKKSFNNSLAKFRIRIDYANVIRLFDFGCADGRLLPLFQEIADQNQDLQIELIGYDINITALMRYADRLKQNNYFKLPYPENRDGTYIFGIWQNRNLKITLIHSNDASLNKLKSLIGKPLHVVYSIFSSLDHILQKKSRQNKIKLLKELIDEDGEIIVNVSTPISFKNEFITYQTLRNHLEIARKYNLNNELKALQAVVGSATEKGDIYYIKSNKNTGLYVYSHVYTRDEIIEDIEQAGLFMKSLGVMSIKKPHELSSNIWSQYQDFLLSMILSFDLSFYPFSSLDKIAQNIFVVAKKKPS